MAHIRISSKLNFGTVVQSEREKIAAVKREIFGFKNSQKKQ